MVTEVLLPQLGQTMSEGTITEWWVAEGSRVSKDDPLFSFTPIMNPPEAAILGIGRILDRPVVVGKAVAVCPTLTLSLSFDHRLVDGAAAARFLQSVVGYLEEPALLLT